MKFQYKIYTTLLVSFILLIASLVISYKNVHTNNQVLNYLSKNHIELTHDINQLNYELKTNQTLILQYILLQKNFSSEQISISFQNIDSSLKELQLFIRKQNLPDNFTMVLQTVQNRTIAYRFIEKSILKAIKEHDKEDLQDAIIGFNNVIQKFSDDTKILTDLSTAILYNKITALEKNNERSSYTLLFSFFVAFLLISFSIYKFNTLHNHLKKAQKKILKYNKDLQQEVLKKTAQLHKKIYTHHISGLANRNKLLEDATSHTFTRMALLNIDRFQSFNDVYGEDIGNIALKMSADFLKKEISDFHQVLLYHIGGDEFVIVCISQQDENNQIFLDLINKILQQYNTKVFTYKNKTFQFTMSCGITFSGKNKMLAYADMALKEAKKKNIQLSIFHEDKALEKKYKDDIKCHKKLKVAIQKNNIISFFQPIIPIQDTKIATKYESLVRLKDENGKIIAPFKFLNVAKAHRIYYKITEIVIKNTLHVISSYQLPCSLNLSLSDIQNQKTMEYFFDLLDSFQYNELLTVELLETEDFNDYKMVVAFCLKVRSYGVKIALDDFGSGYSNFSHILNIPIDYIKIDASLISNIDKNQNSKIMVETIVSLAKKLHIMTIAEFVSSKEILDVVKDLGVDYAQGYHFGKPLPIKEHIKSEGS